MPHAIHFTSAMDYVQTKGCLDAIVDWARIELLLVIGASIGICLLEGLGITLLLHYYRSSKKAAKDTKENANLGIDALFYYYPIMVNYTLDAQELAVEREHLNGSTETNLNGPDAEDDANGSHTRTVRDLNTWVTLQNSRIIDTLEGSQAGFDP
ncbi:unnamed protein product [Lepeophtheirus salmonis]|uniref:(salmon louse) hypothetical protein n=1 Tax=Lepeophtheirus salmonis TaxID=72036 RepID=A0A7R8HCZ0_LEPSM|nr:unnamed protein product [Lepeophtheirus salmonis]CAF3012953.1 unnamed protein product [Lepeophtheirus salmonis]